MAIDEGTETKDLSFPRNKSSMEPCERISFPSSSIVQEEREQRRRRKKDQQSDYTQNIRRTIEKIPKNDLQAEEREMKKERRK